MVINITAEKSNSNSSVIFFFFNMFFKTALFFSVLLPFSITLINMKPLTCWENANVIFIKKNDIYLYIC